MKKVATAIFALIILTCGFFARTQDVQKKIEQENGKGLYAPHVTYGTNRINRVVSNDSAFQSKLQVAMAEKFDRQLPLATIK